jgi:two-component system, chemotaxis family, CheB/CheR fusion protein
MYLKIKARQQKAQLGKFVDDRKFMTEPGYGPHINSFPLFNRPAKLYLRPLRSTRVFMKTKEGKKAEPKACPIVAIGASAGGIEAVSELIQNLPATTGMAFVYIQHLDPTHKSLLSEILSRQTKMKVQDAKNLMRIEPNNVYVIPHNKDLFVVDHVLKLNNRKPKPAVNLPVDKFFKSLAENHKEAAIGIVLSGNANDGTSGLKEIKNSGGITFAQDSSAQFQSMPKSAIAEGCVDMVLSPREIAIELGRISQNRKVFDHILTENIGDSGPELQEEDLEKVIELLRKSTGVDFQHYKPKTIKRRIIRRMVLNKLETLRDYSKYAKRNPDEIKALFQDLLINVTSFFRDADALEFLKKNILPKIIKSKGPIDSIRLWVPACSTGEEAYSLAMIFSEVLSEKGRNIPLQIFASDLSDNAIAKARVGVYSKADVADVSQKRLQRFFTRIDGSYRINKAIRDLCVFAPHNLLSDPPFSRVDLITCCNLLIYLNPVLQKKVLSTLQYSLNNGGYLMLGKSETLGASSALFSQVDKKFKVFIKKAEATNNVRFEMTSRLSGRPSKTGARNVLTKNPSPKKVMKFEKSVEEVLLSKYVPASVVVNKELEILQLHGPVKSFIEITPGKATLNLLKLVKTGIVFDLRNTIHKAAKSNLPQKKSGIELDENGSARNISIEVTPLVEQNKEKIFLIVFEKSSITPSKIELDKTSFRKDQVVKRLQRELEAAKDDMRSILEEQEANNEELQSANEEIVSSNEELQSINEELETSKEEVESSNEELTTINNELQVRNEQLAESHEYSEAVAETIREAVLILDKDFRVRSANKAFYRIFKTTEEQTEGVLLYELGNRQWNILELRQLLEDLMTRTKTINGFEVQHDFPLIGHKTMLLHARTIVQKAQQKQIVILVIEDITVHRLAQQAAREKELWFKNMANNAPSIIWMTGENRDRTFFNQTYYEFTGADREMHSSWREFIHPQDLGGYNREFEKSFETRSQLTFEYRLRRADGEYRWMLDLARPYFSSDNKFLGFIGTSTELHDKKLMLEELDKKVRNRTRKLSALNTELQRSNKELEQFAYIASHDLQEPLRKILTYIDRIQHEGDLPETFSPYFEKIIESSRRMTKLIDDLLEFSSISYAEKKFVSVNLNNVMEDVLSDLETPIREKNARIEYERNLPGIEGDPLQLSQLFHNLVSNAIKFSREDTPPILKIDSRLVDGKELSMFEKLSQSSKYVELTFADNGIGFDMEFAEQIFVIFQRLHEKRKYPGTGIGLALCKRIVNNHRGEIYAESSESGATFRMILPVKQKKSNEGTV